jgi:hypothetical protein
MIQKHSAQGRLDLRAIRRSEKIALLIVGASILVAAGVSAFVFFTT